MSSKSQKLLVGMLCVAMTLQSVPFALLADAHLGEENVRAEAVFAETLSDDEAAASFDRLYADESVVEGIDFSSKRLLIGDVDPADFTSDTAVLADYDGVYMLGFADEFSAKSAYTYYYNIAGFVEPDLALFTADDEYVNTASMLFSDLGSDAFTHLRRLTETETGQRHYDIAIIDTGIANGAADAVSVLGGEGVDDNGHGTAVYSTVMSVSDDLSVLSVKAFDQRGIGYVSSVYAAMLYAVAQGVDVINLSAAAESATDSVLLNRAVSKAAEAGIAVVGAAGNDGADASGYIPARLNGVYIAGACDENGVKRSNSNYGETVFCNAVADSASEAAAKLSAMIAVFGTERISAELNQGILYTADFSAEEDETVIGVFDEQARLNEDGSYTVYDRLKASQPQSSPWLKESELTDATLAAIQSDITALAEETGSQGSQTVDNTTIQRLTVRWLTPCTGEDEPAYYDRLVLQPTSDTVEDQQFQIDFALSGQQAYEPGQIELVFPASIWKDRDSNDVGVLTLSIPEGPEDNAEFVWTRQGDKIIVTNAKKVAAASKVMIQGTFRNLTAHEMKDMYYGEDENGELKEIIPFEPAEFSAYLTVVTPRGNQISMSSNTIDATIDTSVKVDYAAKTAYNSTAKSYDVWWKDIPAEIPAELLPENPDDYMYIRWYVSGTASGNQPFDMYVTDTIAMGDDNEPLFGGVMLGVSEAANGAVVKSEDGKTVTAPLYSGYSTAPKSAYVWTAYPKTGENCLPQDQEITIPNKQTISVVGQDDDIETTATADNFVKTKSPSDYYFVKVWDDDDNARGVRPDILYLDIYREDYSATNPWRTVTLDKSYETEPDGNSWKYKWSDDGQVCHFDVGERLVRNTGVVGEPVFDAQGHEVQWNYYLSDQKYDLNTRTWTYTNTYGEKDVDFEISNISKFCEYNFRDNNVVSTRDNLSLNSLLNGKDVYVDYTVSATVSAASESVWHGVTPNKFVLLDGRYSFNKTELPVEDVDVGKFTFELPTVFRYLPGDGDALDRRKRVVVAEIPDTHLYGKVGEEWIRFATLHTDGTVTAENDATIEGWAGTTVALPENVSAVKVELISEDAAVRLAGIVTLRVKHTDTVKEMIRKGFETGDFQVLPLENVVDAYVEYAGEDVKTIDGKTYRNGTQYNALWARDTGFLHGRVFKVAADLTKSFVLTASNPATRMITMASELTLTQQSNVLSQEDYLQAIANNEIPNTNSGTYYDLLPVGVDPVLDSVKAGGNDTVLDKWLVPNYKDSGRTLLVVKVKLTDNFSQTTVFSPKRYTENNYPEEGYKNTHTLTFDSVCTWDVAQNRDNLTNMHNVSAYQADEGEVGSLEFWKGETGDLKSSDNNLTPNAFSGNERNLMTNLDSTDSNPSFVYAGAKLDNATADFAAVSGLDKAVQVTGSGKWSKGLDNEVNVQESGLYSYRLRITSGVDTQTSDIILLDSLENYQPHDSDSGEDIEDTHWRGKLLSIDLAQIRAAGVDPVVYYTLEKKAEDISDYHALNPDGSIKDDDTTNVQEILENHEDGWTVLDGDLPDADIVAIAIDMRMGTNNEPFVLKPDKTLIVTLNMQAPYDKKTDSPPYFKGTDGTDHLQNAHAYNDVYLDCKQVFEEGAEVKETQSYINYSYTKVGIYTKYLDIVKEWDDNNDSDGKRPDKITVTLTGDGEPIEDIELTAPDWKGKSGRLLTYNEDGSYIRYTFEETFENQDEYPDKTVKRETLADGTDRVTIINKHEPEKISVPVIKLWDDENDREMKRPSAITVELYANGKPTGKTLTIRPDDKGEWSGTFTNLDKYYDHGKLIKYTVVEDVDDYKRSDTETTLDEDNGTFTIKLTNKYHPIGSLRVTKKLENATAEAKKNTFRFTLRLTTMDGDKELDVTNRYPYVILDSEGETVSEGTIGHGDEFDLMDGQTFVIPEMPTHILYSVEETGNKSGFTLTSVSGESGEIRSARPAEAVFTNTYAAKGNAQMKVKKVLTGRKLAGYQFKFELKDEDGKVLRTAYNNADGDAIFGNIGYTDADVGKEFFYTINEVREEKPGYTYSDEVIRVKVTPVDRNGDGTLDCDIEYIGFEENETPEITNIYRANGAIAFRAWKTIEGGSVGDKIFTFVLSDADGQTVGAPVHNNGSGTVDFPRISYTEKDVGEVYWYYARETAEDDPTVIYDTAVIGYRVEVVDNGDGTLSFNQSAYYMYNMCRNCGGTGYEYELCEACGGKGKADNDTCTACGGTGKRVGDACAVCGETGMLPANDFVTFCEECLGEAGKECDICNGLGFTVEIPACETCGGTGETKDGTCETCGGSGTALPASGDTPVFDNGLEDGGITVAKYTSDGSPDQEFRFKVVLEGRDVDKMTGEYEVALADPRPFPDVNAPQTQPAPKPAAAKGTVVRAASVRRMAARPAVVQLAAVKTMAAEDGIMPLADHGTVMKDANGNPLSGTVGTNVSWTIYEDHTLVLKPTNSAYEAILTTSETSTANQTRAFPWGPGQQSSSIKPAEQIYTVEIEGTIYGVNLLGLFSGCTRLTDIIGWNNLDTSRAVNMACMFYNCSRLNFPDLSNLQTGNVTSMESMFYNSKLISGDFSRWDTSKVQSMKSMFSYCNSLISLNLSDWKFSQVGTNGYVDLSLMFYYSQSLKSVNFSNWDTTYADGTKGTYDMFGSNSFYPTPIAEITIGSKFFTTFIPNISSKHIWIRRDDPEHGDLQYYDVRTDVGPDEGNITFIWKDLSTYTIIFAPGGTEDGTPVTGSMPTAVWETIDPYEIPECTFVSEGYILDHWEDGLGNEYGPEATIPADKYQRGQVVTLTAVWQKPEYTVRFNEGQGATGSMDIEKVIISKDYPVPPCGFVNFGYVFVGWLRSDTDEIIRPGEIIPAGTFKAGDSVTLTAQWEESRRTFQMENGTFEFTLHGGYQATFTGLPAGTTYQIYEETEFGWVLVSANDTSGTIEPLEIQQAQFYNLYKEGVITARLIAAKYLDGSPAAADAKNTPFKFALYKSDENGTIGELVEEVEAKNGGLVQFKDLEYDEEDTYYYVMRELDTENGTLNYDSKDVLVTVEVTDISDPNDTTETKKKLKAEVSYSVDGKPYERVTFENTTKPGSLEIQKTAKGSDAAIAEAEFRFRVRLYGSNGMPMSDGTVNWYTRDSEGAASAYAEDNVLTNGEIIVSCKANETIVLENLPAGTTYEIEEIEIPNGWTLDTAENTDGEIKAGDTATASFTNSYSAEGHTSITLHKLFQGGTLEAGMFKFELYELVAQQASRTSNVDEDGQLTGEALGKDIFIDTVQIPGADKLTVTVPEIACSVGGALYLVAGSYSGGIPADGAYAYKITQADTGAYDIMGDTVTFVFVSNGTSAVYYSANAVGLKGEPVTVSNSMTDNRETVYDEVLNQTVPNPWLGYAPIVYDGLVFTKPGTYQYYIREVADDSADGIIFDDHAETVEITVTDNGKGLLTIADEDIRYLGSEAFVNRSAGHLTVSKTFLVNEKVPDSVRDMAFDFMVELRDANDELLTGIFDYSIYDSDDTEVYSGTISANTDSISIQGGQRFTIFDLPNGTKYQVTEQSVTGIELESSVDASGTVVSGEEHTAAFTNVYAGSAALTLNAHKRYLGGKISENMFAFELKSGDDVLQTVYADADGTISFDPIIFVTADLNREYTYTISEVNGGLSNLQYDSHEAVIRVKITRDKNGAMVVNLLDDSGSEILLSDSELTLTEETVPALAFTNAALADLAVTKQVVGDYDDESFTFSLLLDNAAGLPENIVWQKGMDFGVFSPENLPYEFKLKANETIVFTRLPLGTVYTVVETEHAGYTATVGGDRTDTDKGEITESGDNTAAFVNIANVFAAPEATKTLTGRALKDGEFTFEMALVSAVDADGKTLTDGITMPDDCTAKNDGEGNITFEQIEFSKAGTYTVSISEKAGDDETITYDERVFSVVYKVTKNPDGTLACVTEYFLGEEKITKPEFLNSFEETTTSSTDATTASTDATTSATSETESTDATTSATSKTASTDATTSATSKTASTDATTSATSKTASTDATTSATSKTASTDATTSATSKTTSTGATTSTTSRTTTATTTSTTSRTTTAATTSTTSRTTTAATTSTTSRTTTAATTSTTSRTTAATTTSTTSRTTTAATTSTTSRTTTAATTSTTSRTTTAATTSTTSRTTTATTTSTTSRTTATTSTSTTSRTTATTTSTTSRTTTATTTSTTSRTTTTATTSTTSRTNTTATTSTTSRTTTTATTSTISGATTTATTSTTSETTTTAATTATSAVTTDETGSAESTEMTSDTSDTDDRSSETDDTETTASETTDTETDITTGTTETTETEADTTTGTTETTVTAEDTTTATTETTATDDITTDATETTTTEDITTAATETTDTDDVTTETTQSMTTADTDTTSAVTATSSTLNTGEWGTGDEITATTLTETTRPSDETEDSDARTTTTESSALSTSNTEESDNRTVTTTAKSSSGGGAANNSGSSASSGSTSNSVHTGDSAPAALMIVAILMSATAVACSKRRDDES